MSCQGVDDTHRQSLPTDFRNREVVLGSTVVVAVKRPSGFALGSVTSCTFFSATITWFQAKSTRNSESARAHLLQLRLYPPRRDYVASGLSKFLKAG
jgi:hypothetical protein